MTPFRDVQSAVDDGVGEAAGRQVMVIMDGSVLVPRVVRMSDYIEAENLREAKKTMMTCTYCGFCKSVCPVFEGIGWDPSVARGRMILSYGLLQKDIPADESVVENLYQCTTCKDCERRCPSNIEVVEVVERARKDLVAAGEDAAPTPRLGRERAQAWKSLRGEGQRAQDPGPRA